MKKQLTQIEFASLGGRARAKKLSKERRTEIAKMGGKASYEKRLLVDKFKI